MVDISLNTQCKSLILPLKWSQYKCCRSLCSGTYLLSMSSGQSAARGTETPNKNKIFILFRKLKIFKHGCFPKSLQGDFLSYTVQVHYLMQSKLIIWCRACSLFDAEKSQFIFLCRAHVLDVLNQPQAGMQWRTVWQHLRTVDWIWLKIIYW